MDRVYIGYPYNAQLDTQKIFVSLFKRLWMDILASLFKLDILDIQLGWISLPSL